MHHDLVNAVKLHDEVRRIPRDACADFGLDERALADRFDRLYL